MYRVKGSGRACIEHPEKHTAGILKGGERPSRFNPHFQVPEQKPPTPHEPLRQRFKFGSEGHRDSLHHNPGPGTHNERGQKPDPLGDPRSDYLGFAVGPVTGGIIGTALWAARKGRELARKHDWGEATHYRGPGWQKRK
jgi:hypothetical protein